jgi:hypothetical protein
VMTEDFAFCKRFSISTMDCRDISSNSAPPPCLDYIPINSQALHRRDSSISESSGSSEEEAFGQNTYLRDSQDMARERNAQDIRDCIKRKRNNECALRYKQGLITAT